jgi:SIR2-like protein
MPPIKRLEEKDWEVLLRRIRDGRCTPFIGAGVYAEGPSLRTAVARKWAAQYSYPLGDGTDLARVARFVNVDFGDAETASVKYLDELRQVPVPKFEEPNEPYTVLAKLPLPIYITTNYDDFMEQALAKQHRDVKKDLCKWIKSIEELSPIAEQNFRPNAANPSVYHLYGYSPHQQSLVLSEDDYFQFLINVSKDMTLIPPVIQSAISGNSVMLLGYSIEDWDFRVLFHFLAGYLKANPGKAHVAVQISPLSKEAPADIQQRAQAFFDKYFNSRIPDIRVSWNTTQEFITELKTRWEASSYAN